jgi:hypothetical protein
VTVVTPRESASVAEKLCSPLLKVALVTMSNVPSEATIPEPTAVAPPSAKSVTVFCSTAPIPAVRQKQLAKPFETWDERKACCRASVCHDVILLRGFVTPSLAAQGRQRLPSYFNIQRGYVMQS